MNQQIFVTGALGFIGSALIPHLSLQGYPLIAATRHPTNALPIKTQQVAIGDLLSDTNWIPLLKNVDIIIHLAARVHIIHDTSTHPLTEFRRTNTTATLNLAKQAALAGVRRFVYLSSIKVNGEISQPGQPFTVDDTNIPVDLYALSKYEAEQGLREIAQQTGLEVVIIRPPLVYGIGVRGNVQNMMRWLYKDFPLPLGNIHNQRSLVALPNLIDLITICIDHPAAANQTFIVSDGKDISTTELLKELGMGLGKPARLLPVSQKLLEATLNLLGKQAIARRLCGNLQIDMSKTCELLNWKPPANLNEELEKTAHAYLQTLRKQSL